MDLTLKLTGTPNQPQKKITYKTVISKSIQFIVLLAFMVLLASHESINPRFGKSYIDFFDFENRQSIEFQLNNLDSILGTSSDNLLDGRIKSMVSEFYKIRDYKPAWTINYTTSVNFEELMQLMDTSAYFGFPRNYFNSDSLLIIKNLITTANPENINIETRTKLEFQATSTALTLMFYIRMGIQPNDSDAVFSDYMNNLPNLLSQITDKNLLTQSVIGLQPKLLAYQQLISSVPEFMHIYNLVETLEKPSNDTLKRAFFYCGIQLPDSLSTVENMVQLFQQKNKLLESGIYDSATQQKLVESLHFKYLQFCLNLDRLRKIDSQDGNYLFVNIPEYKLHLIENNKEQQTLNVIVGRTETPTPVLSSNVVRIIANPDWTVPSTIAVNEMLSKIRSDSNFLQRNGYSIVDKNSKPVNTDQINWENSNPFGSDYYIKQNRSDKNALGKLKFVFPNSHSVYLHDTPTKKLFASEKRTYSHGCIRVQYPEKLAQYLADRYLKKSEDSVKIEKLISNSKQQVLSLEEKVSIHIQYITCIQDGSGDICFLNDVYGLDEVAINELFPV